MTEHRKITSTSTFTFTFTSSQQVGLGLANALGNFGCKVMLVETRKECVPDSRFFNLNSNTMEIYDRLGVSSLAALAENFT